MWGPELRSKSWSAGRATQLVAEMRRWSFVAMVAVLMLSGLARPCHAERVVLVRPNVGDVVLNEIFNRLQGELRMHGFDTILASASGVPAAAELGRVAELAQAMASVATERVELDLVAHVWFPDRETGESRVMSISLPETEEAPTLLALRTVELLRSSLRERADPFTATAAALPQSPAQARVDHKLPSPGSSAAPPTPRIVLRSEGTIFWSALGNNPVPGFALSGGYRIVSRWTMAARFSLPLASNRLEAKHSRADYHVYRADIEARWPFALFLRQFGLEPLFTIGVARCVVSGHAIAPITGVNVATWTMTMAAGVGTWLRPLPRLSIGSVARIGVMVPKPLILVEQVQRPLGRPWVEVGISLDYAL